LRTRHHARAAVLGVLALILTLAIPPGAAQAAPPPVPVPKPAGPAPDPLRQLPAPGAAPRPQPVEEEHGAGFGSAGTPPAGLPAVTGGDLQKKALERAAALGNKSIFDTTRPQARAGLSALAAPPATPSAADVKRCEDEALPQGWKALDRFTFCGRTTAYHYSVDTAGKRNGFMSMTMLWLGYGRDDGTRNVVLFAKPTSVIFFGQVYTPATTFGVEAECYHIGDDGCSGSGEVRATMAEWEARWLTGSWVRYELGSDEARSTRPDKVSYHWFEIKFRFVNGLDDTSEIGFRCDSATYIPNKPKACVFSDTIPVLQYARFDAAGNPTNQKEVAEHIRQAQDNPDSTWPPEDHPKDIPGKWLGSENQRYLTRIDTSGQYYKDNVAEKNRACRPLQPPDGTVDPQCDEYPFASTEQGASHPRYDYSVKYVTGSQNGSAGTLLRQFYENNRLLYDIEQFYVDIVERAGPGAQPPIVSAGPAAYGKEGDPIPLRGSARSSSGAALSVEWAYEPISDVDPGTSCLFSGRTTVTPSITCNDDGVFRATISVSDGTSTSTDSTHVYVENKDPEISFTQPTPWQLFRVGAPIIFDAPIVDAANDDHTCQYAWDEGGSDPWDDPFPALGRKCNAVHSFEHAGMYTVTVFVADDDGGTGAANVMIIVYDPNEGAANIDGSTATPSGALVTAPNATGQTWVHHTGQYQPGASVPVGQGKAWLDGTDFRLEPTGLEWLVITEDGKVASRGTGTVAGRSGYTWVMYGWDACPGAARPGCMDIPVDRVRLVVFETANGHVLYDHSPGSGEYDVDRIFPKDMTSGAVQIHRYPR
jgi:hypothetical protein